jgi:hypothetical protein
MIFSDNEDHVAKFIQAFKDLQMQLDLQTGFEIQIVVNEVDASAKPYYQ